MSEIHVVFPTAEIEAALDAATVALHQQRKELLDVVGVQLLQFAKLAYEEKSHGKQGRDGITWDWITVGTLMGRLRKAGHVKVKPKTINGKAVKSLTVSKTVKANQQLFTQLAKAGVRFRDKSGKVIKGSRNRTKAGTTIHADSDTRSRKVKVAPGSYQIGINTGLQRNSATPGFVGPDGKGGNIKTVSDTVLTVGFGRSYSKYFDAKRKLFPDQLPEPWREELEELLSDAGGKIIEKAFKEGGIS